MNKSIASLPQMPQIDRDRLFQSIQQLAQVGQLPNGGVQRLAFSHEDVAARHQIKQQMQLAGMSVHTDTAGNIIGRYDGKHANAPVLATGSHIDTVPNAGHYDGAYGVLAGIEVVRSLHSQNMRLHHPIEVIVFTDEESSMIGSKAMSGSLDLDPHQYTRSAGTSIQSCLEKVGGNWEQIAVARRSEKEIAAFVELHVEQGPVLEALGQEIGVVEGIVGQRRYRIIVQGIPQHAGTTPMSMRQDALVAAAHVVLAVNRLANQPGQQVATVGYLQVSPNAANTIPGWVEMRLDIRDLSDRRIDEILAELQQEIIAIAAQSCTQIEMELLLHNIPVLANMDIQQIIATACQTFNYSYTHLPSRASHDAQEMAKFTNMGMIFVPSQGGVSHSELEYTSPEQCIQGANVLLQVLLALDRKYAL
jgi:beta-ureidopropionase / N-carbamoyl-L-amino-acid hydrolase